MRPDSPAGRVLDLPPDDADPAGWPIRYIDLAGSTHRGTIEEAVVVCQAPLSSESLMPCGEWAPYGELPACGHNWMLPGFACMLDDGRVFLVELEHVPEM